MEPLEKHLPRPIKEVITEFPAILDILNDYDIGCGPCMVGTCLFKDIVSIHNLPRDTEQEMMKRIAAVVAPSGPETAVQASGSTPRKREAHIYSAPIQKLVDEHVVIKLLLALIPELLKNVDVTSAAGKEIITDGIDFIRSYADKFHHGKEEEILFQRFDEASEIIQAMHADHETGRRHVQAIRTALEINDAVAVKTHLQAYRELLMEHIKKEDEILFPWMDRNLSASDKDDLSVQFSNADRAAGADLSTRYRQLLCSLEQRIK
jgi:hemerythrin-like domain-containing protein